MDYKISGDSLNDIADAIREKTESSETMLLSEMPDAIRAIETGDKLQPVIYSLEEREIGVWTDGKPLYQKTFLPNYQSSYSSGIHEMNVPIDIHDLNVDTVVNLFGVWERYAGDLSRLLYHFGSGESQYGYSWLRVDSENGYHNGRINATITSENTDWQEITIQYTKTTDVAGSGIWTTSGIPAVHYDGNEKIIGTWFGETLYERTFDCGQLGNNTVITYAHNISNISRIVELKGVAYESTQPEAANILPVINGGTDYIRFRADATNIYFKCQDNWSSYNALATLRYTKTTD